MEYLDTVKEKIANYIAKEPVQETEEIISAYTLFAAVEDCKKRLRHVGEIEKGLVDKLNTIYPQTIIKEKKGIFTKKSKQDHFESAYHYIKDTHSELNISGDHHHAGLAKDYGYNDIYSTGCRLTEEAYAECTDEITDIFSVLDYIGELYSKDNKKTNLRYGSKVTNQLNCEGFDLTVNFIAELWQDPKFSYGIELNEKIAPNGHANAHFYGQDNNIDKVINDNMVAILKNTPVNIGDLSYMFFIIVSDYRAHTEKDRINEEIDKAFQKLYEKK